MGSGVSTQELDQLKPDRKSEIVQCIKTTLSTADVHNGDDREKEMIQTLSTQLDKKIKDALQSQQPPQAEPVQSSASLETPEDTPTPAVEVVNQGLSLQEPADDQSSESSGPGSTSPTTFANAALENLSKQISRMLGPTNPAGIEINGAPGARKDFRQRRLTFAMQRERSNSATVGDVTTIYASAEIGAERKVTVPFPSNILGTYSCHGIEPSWTDEGYTEKINQDRGCVVHPFRSTRREALFCVFDGHGEHGDLVSQFAMTEIARRLEVRADLSSTPEKVLGEVFIEVDRALQTEAVVQNPTLEPLFSGTTAVVVYMAENVMWIANTGDSRAVLCVKHGSTNRAVNLSRDHNPDTPTEHARILSSGGFVSAPPEEGLSARVWLDPDCTQIGLAMSRSIGDHAVKTVGVIADPEVVPHEIAPEDHFLILASDGVWEFIPSQEAVDIVASEIEHGAESACQKLISTAAERWRNNEGDYRDDITAVIIVLPVFAPSTA